MLNALRKRETINNFSRQSVSNEGNCMEIEIVLRFFFFLIVIQTIRRQQQQQTKKDLKEQTSQRGNTTFYAPLTICLFTLTIYAFHFYNFNISQIQSNSYSNIF